VTAEFTTAEQGCFDAGWFEGFEAGVATTEASYQAWLGGARTALRLPTQDALDAARTRTNDPCPARCQSCSRCIRYEAAWRNMRTYGSADYPGRRSLSGASNDAPAASGERTAA